MNTATEVLVIITSSILVVFLIVAIVLAVLVIRVTAKIKKVANSAEVVAENIGKATRGMGRASTPLFFVNLLRGLVNNKKGK
jgi:type II secretory pathway pseudopilin PulG